MRLLRCHVENFGILSDFDLTFTEGLNVLCRENGFGKSTLAAFLKAMFYGLPKTRAKASERKRYDPWQGGKYGGFLEFEYRGNQYRVTRYFGKKEDSFSLTDLTNRTESTAFSEKLGEELFQLDADSFARSTFVPQLSDREITATTSIRAKLTNLVEDTNDLNNFDTAMKKLQEYRKSLKLIGVVAVGMTIGSMFIIPHVARFFVGYDENLLILTTRAFRLYGLSFLIMGFNVYASSFFTALGDDVTSALISFLRTLLFQVAAVLLLPLVLGIDGIWLAVTAAELAALAVSAAMFVTKDKVFHYRKA